MMFVEAESLIKVHSASKLHRVIRPQQTSRKPYWSSSIASAKFMGKHTTLQKLINIYIYIYIYIYMMFVEAESLIKFHSASKLHRVIRPQQASRKSYWSSSIASIKFMGKHTTLQKLINLHIFYLFFFIYLPYIILHL